MATEEENTLPPDDRWSAFKDPCRGSSLGVKPREDPKPDLSEYIEKVLEQMSPKKQHERLYKVASQLVHLVTGLAQALTTEWRIYLQTDKKNKIETTAVRMLAQNQYECMVPLMRPLKPDAFKIVRKRHGELSPYRYNVMVNPALSKEEALLVRREWEPYVDKDGHLQPNGILDWFNTGLTKACSVLMAESEYVSSLRCETLHDGTVLVHATISSKRDPIGDEHSDKDDYHVDTFSINIYPVFTIDSLNMPPDLRFSSPLPPFGSHILVQKNLKQAILDDLENGKQIVFLESKNENCYSSQVRRSLPSKESLSWRLNLNFTEHHIFQAMDKYCKTVDFRQVLILMNIIREQYPLELRILNNEILVNSIFIVSQKKVSRLNALHDWFLELVKDLIKGLRICFIPSFYLPRQNLLINYNVTETECRMALGVLSDMLTSLKQNPTNIYDLTGYIEKKKNKQDADESEEDTESHSGNEETDDIIEDNVESNVDELHTC